MLWQKAYKDSSGPDGEVWTTISKIGPFTFGIIFAADLKNSFVISPNAAGFSAWVCKVIVRLQIFVNLKSLSVRQHNFYLQMTDYKYIVFPYDAPEKSQAFDNSSPLELMNCTRSKFCLYYVTPIFEMRWAAVFLF